MGIVDLTGNLVVKYWYDTWGNTLSVTGSGAGTVGQVNPFRYKGYYWDSELGLYYLNSRYYDPVTSRFINADGLVTSGGLLGNNMFAYCENNPVNRCDCSGHCSHCNEFAAYISNILNAAVAVVAAASCPPDAVQALISATAQAQAELTAFVARMHPPTPPAAPAKVKPVDNDRAPTCVFGCKIASHHHVALGHTGTDFGSDPPRTKVPVRAATSGTVIFAGNKGDSGGNRIHILTSDGKYRLEYLHLSKFIVKNGSVGTGQDIGYMGNTNNGKIADMAVHLHFSVWDISAEKYIDPVIWLAN